MAQWTEDREYVYGRIGYQEPGSLEELWNDSKKDFEERQLVLGTTSPFVIDRRDITNIRVAYQLRAGRIRPTTFTANLQALLNQAAGKTWRWRVSPIVVGIPWEQWIEDVDRITELRVRVDRPNPNYGGRRRVRSLIEDTNAAMAEIVLRARREGQGIDLGESLVAEAIEHAVEYGSRRAKAERQVDGQTEEVYWRSEEQGVSPQAEVPADPVTGEVDHQTMQGELDRHTDQGGQ